jgi:hypothetical protein
MLRVALNEKTRREDKTRRQDEKTRREDKTRRQEIMAAAHCIRWVCGQCNAPTGGVELVGQT